MWVIVFWTFLLSLSAVNRHLRLTGFVRTFRVLASPREQLICNARWQGWTSSQVEAPEIIARIYITVRIDYHHPNGLNRPLNNTQAQEELTPCFPYSTKKSSLASIAVIRYFGCNNRKTISLTNGQSENERIQNCFGSMSPVYGRTLNSCRGNSCRGRGEIAFPWSKC